MAAVDETADDKYSSGFAAGRISARLDTLEQHALKVNGNLGDLLTWTQDFRKEMRDALAAVRLELARLAQDSTAKESQVLAAATAVESARVATARQLDETRLRSEVIQIPWTRIFAIIGAIGVIVGIIVLLVKG